MLAGVGGQSPKRIIQLSSREDSEGMSNTRAVAIPNARAAIAPSYLGNGAPRVAAGAREAPTGKLQADAALWRNDILRATLTHTTLFCASFQLPTTPLAGLLDAAMTRNNICGGPEERASYQKMTKHMSENSTANSAASRIAYDSLISLCVNALNAWRAAGTSAATLIAHNLFHTTPRRLYTVDGHGINGAARVPRLVTPTRAATQ